jgi:hypothetical protein
MEGPRPLPGVMTGDPLASDVAYSAATMALARVRAGGKLLGDMPTTQVAGIAVTAAAPYVARDLLRHLAAVPWWRRRRTMWRLLAEAEQLVREQGVIR